MNEGIQVDEVINNDILYFLPIHLCSHLVQMRHVLHQHHRIQLQLFLISDEGLLYHNESLFGLIFQFFMLRFGKIADGSVGKIIQKSRFEYKGNRGSVVRFYFNDRGD